MAVAGLHNVPDFTRPFFGESPKRDSGRWDDDHCRRSTRASALLQMWRVIEGEHVLTQSHRLRQQRNGNSECRSTSTSVGAQSENDDGFSQASDEYENQSSSSSETEHDENNSIVFEQSSDFGEIERGRVRQVFREWTNICPEGNSPYGFNRKNSSGHCHGDSELERVINIREVGEITTLRTINSASSKDDSELGSEIVQVRNALVINHPEIGARRPFRRLCGRQTLLDLILKAQNERKSELLSLSEQSPVSDFAHRNRIQALLRGRFLRNGGLVVGEGPSAGAATELGFLRQRHAVSDLRVGFLSKLDNSASASVNCESSCNDSNKGESESTCTEGGEISRDHIAVHLEGADADGTMNMQELELHNVEADDPVLDNEGSQENTLVCGTSASSREESALAPEARLREVFDRGDHCGSRCEHMNVTVTDELLSESAEINDIGSSEVYIENIEPKSDVSSVHEVADSITNLEENPNEVFDSHDASSQVEESLEIVTEIEDSGWQHLNTIEVTEWADSSRQDIDISWQERAFSHSLPLPSASNVEEHGQTQESHGWPSHDLQEAFESWLDIPSGEAGERGRDMDTFYFPYEDNANSMELRELFSQRRVSSLLGSSFRESLNQVLQSQAERLGHASVDWELESTSFPTSVEQDEEQLHGNQSLPVSESADINTFAQSSAPFEAQQLWSEDLQVADWSHRFSDQPLVTEWDVLRIDVARLQERMNNVQGMLEACMDMQIELQQSLHHEVSEALYRSSRDADASKVNQVHDESHLDHVKRGICCRCQHSKIDSLLYRCGHMCTCTNCAEILVQSRGKCPMCRAPVVEAVRSYFVQL